MTKPRGGADGKRAGGGRAGSRGAGSSGGVRGTHSGDRSRADSGTRGKRPSERSGSGGGVRGERSADSKRGDSGTKGRRTSDRPHADSRTGRPDDRRSGTGSGASRSRASEQRQMNRSDKPGERGARSHDRRAAEGAPARGSGRAPGYKPRATGRDSDAEPRTSRQRRDPAARVGRRGEADRVVGAYAVQGRARSGSGGADSRMPEPPIPDDADPRLLDSSVRAELKTLSKPNAQAVAAHLVAAGHLIDADPVRALAHARAARGRAARVAAVREATGVAAYHAGEWAEALSELRTARRISGDPRDIAMIADCERALGRPEQAVRMLNDPDARRLDPETFAELLIVVAGARRDLGQLDSALTVLARGGLDRARPRPGAMRLWYAYADALAAGGRDDEAAQWFAASAALDVSGETDAADRAAALL